MVFPSKSQAPGSTPYNARLEARPNHLADEATTAIRGQIPLDIEWFDTSRDSLHADQVTSTAPYPVQAFDLLEQGLCGGI